MAKVAVTYSPIAGGSSVISLKESFQEVGSEVVDADYRQMMAEIPAEKFNKLYATPTGRQQLFAHAKAKAVLLLKDIDCLALSGNSAMIDPELFNKERVPDQSYDFSRTIAELALVHIAIKQGMPILGVCGGHQVIAVYGGGEISDLTAGQMEQQRYMDYDIIKINKDTMLAQIFGAHELNNDTETTLYEDEFFGAHDQIVSKLGNGFKQTAVASDNQSSEAAESEFGVPIITTQFHPEVGAKGFPGAKFIYQKVGYEADINLKIFDYFNKAGNVYNKKHEVLNELKSFRLKNNDLIKPSQIKAQQKKEEAPGPKKQWNSSLGFLGRVFEAISGAVVSLGHAIKSSISNLLRQVLSSILTYQRVQELRKKEMSKNTSEETVMPEKDSAYSEILSCKNLYLI